MSRIEATRWPDRETVTVDASRLSQADLLHAAATGAHSVAWENPEDFAAELRAAFKQFR